LFVRPQTSRGRVRTPPALPRTTLIEKDHSQNVYQEIDSTSTDDDQPPTPNADLQFIRGAIERVFDFHGQSSTDTTSDSSTHYEELPENNLNESTSSKTLSKKNAQYPAVEAIQRFYNHQTTSHSEKQVTNNDKLHSRSPLPSARRKDLSKSKSKSSDHERASSEEVDDTLNDIEDVDYHDEKLKRQATNNSSSHTSNENSPVRSLDIPPKTKKASQETQTFERVCFFQINSFLMNTINIK
jgi:hypothetical protein